MHGFVLLNQQHLFPDAEASAVPLLPEGFRYQAEIISEAEEAQLVRALGILELKPFEFHGFFGNRRVASFGLRYDYSRGGVAKAEEPPEFLAELLKKVAEFSGHAVGDFEQIGINEYRPGAGIGWHRDKAQFGDIVGVSLLAEARMRFRKRDGKTWKRASHLLEPRSIYILGGEARRIWEHSIPPVTSLRYSLTFRTLARSFGAAK